jgi:DMSO reductase anchor subunit
MDRTEEEYGALAAFTALAPLAVGGLVGLLETPALRPVHGIDWATMVVLSTGLLALIASMLHLGRPWRAPLALLRLDTSWLSREVLLFGLFLIALGGYAILPVLKLGSPGLVLIGIAAALIGLAGTVATGATYRLHSRPSWDQWLSVASFPLGALSTGSLFGFFLARQFAGRPAVTALAWAGAGFLLAASLVVSWLRSTRLRPESPEGRLSRQLVLGPELGLLVVRVVAGVVALVMIGAGGGAQFLAWIPALIGEFADRVLFFKTVVPVTLRGRYL